MLTPAYKLNTQQLQYIYIYTNFGCIMALPDMNASYVTANKNTRKIRIQTLNTFVLEAQVQVQYSAMHLQHI